MVQGISDSITLGKFPLIDRADGLHPVDTSLSGCSTMS